MLKKIISILLASILLIGVSNPQENSSKFPQVRIAGTQIVKVHSDITGEDYDIYINLPRNYDTSSENFPVVYLIDAQWDFPLVSAIFGEQYYDGFLPGVIIAGITWSGNNPDYDSLRARDFTPSSNNQPKKFGNASNLLQSIKQEIIPFVERNYKTSNNDRTLMGSSYGGLFTLYALFNETNLFNRYVLTSPAIKFDSSIIYSYEKNYYKESPALPVKLYMAIGSYEDVEDLQKFVDTIRLRNYKGLEFQNDVIDGMGHSGGKAEGYSKGLQFVFKKSSAALAPDILKRYTGLYQFDLQNKIKIIIEENHLSFVDPKNKKFILLPETPEHFFTQGSYGIIDFIKDENGKIEGFEFEEFTGKRFIPKLD